MKILGLFVVVFLIAFVNKLLGSSDFSSMIGVVIGAGTYIMSSMKS